MILLRTLSAIIGVALCALGAIEGYQLFVRAFWYDGGLTYRTDGVVGPISTSAAVLSYVLPTVFVIAGATLLVWSLIPLFPFAHALQRTPTRRSLHTFDD